MQNILSVVKTNSIFKERKKKLLLFYMVRQQCKSSNISLCVCVLVNICTALDRRLAAGVRFKTPRTFPDRRMAAGVCFKTPRTFPASCYYSERKHCQIMWAFY